jgi:hypothetical protein
MKYCLTVIDGFERPPAIRKSPTAAPAIHWCLVLVLYLLAACTGPQGAGKADNLFTANASEGDVLVRVDGMARGFTNSELTRLIKRGMAGSYPIQCHEASDNALDTPKMVWHVINDRRKPTAVVTVKVIESSGIVRSKFANIAAPGVNPDAVFMRDVADLAYRIMPPAPDAVDQIRSEATRCRD